MDLSVSLSAGFELVGDKVDKMHDGLLKRMDGGPKPRYLTLRGQGSSTTSATVPFQIDLQGPPIGFMWDVMGIVVCGLDDHTMVSGSVALYAGDLANVSLLGLMVCNLTIPSYTSVGKDRIWVQPGQEMFANIAGVANTTLVTVGVHVAEWQQKDRIASGVA